EYFDLPTMWTKIQEIIKTEEDANTRIYVSGPPILYAYFLEIMPKMVNVLAASIVMILLILWMEFRSWQGVVIPAFSGALSAIWGLGFGGLWGLNLDPLVLVIPLLISARAHSHSVQSMERYHEEYHRRGRRWPAVRESCSREYGPALWATATRRSSCRTRSSTRPRWCRSSPTGCRSCPSSWRASPS